MLIVRNPRSFDTLDRMFEQLTSGFGAAPRAAAPATPSVRADWHDSSLVLTVDLPGVPRDSVTVEVAERALTIRVQHSDDRGELQLTRTLQLGGSLDADAVSARYADGRLTVTVPPAAAPVARSITIEGSVDEAPAAIEASAEG